MTKQSLSEHLGQYSVLVFQNDESAQAITNYLQEQGFNAWFIEERNILAEITREDYDIDIAILDYYNKYDRPNDLTLVQSFQKYRPDTPIIFCTENDDPFAAVAAYENGVSDFVRKPYNMAELAWRVRTWSKHIPLKFVKLKKEYVIHDMVLNTEDRTFFDGQKTICLTDKELAVMTYLFGNPNQLVLTQSILMAIWHQADIFSKRCLDFYIAAVRKYLTPNPKVTIVTVFNKGYILRIEK